LRSFHFPGRSPVYSTRAMAATSHPLATEAALNVMRSGGNAVDGAIAAVAVMCVTEPAMTGIGGDCFAMVAKPDGSLIALNATGKAPAAATEEFFASQGITAIETTSPHAVTVPGAIDGWVRLVADHGTKPLGDLLDPAIRCARDGAPVAPRVQWDWQKSVAKLSGNDAARALYLRDGQAPAVGQVVKFPELARTLETVAAKGREGFYGGQVAEDMVGALRALGGVHTMDDFAAQSCNYVDPIAVDYGGLTLHELPPNNHGVVALMVLKMFERMGRISDDPMAPERFHVIIEASRLAYQMRDAYVADPDMVDVPVDWLLSDETIEKLVARIDREKRIPDLPPVLRPAGTDTVYLSVVDENGMAVSFINSLFKGFGSGIAARNSGVLFHNRGEGFTLEAGHPNVIAPGKRPMHTLVPAIVTEGGVPTMSFGVMGGQFQPIGHVYVITNMRDYGMDAQEALDFPRAFFEGENVMVEESVPVSVREGLAAMGHPVKVRAEAWGGGQIIQMDRENGVLIGASDPRKDGMAAGY
jgi:gamma-glutamyltranspeptidase/glutathione hydrolase